MDATLNHAKFGSDPRTEMTYGVVTFDPKNGIWIELDALDVAMPCSISTPSLAESNGRLMMVGKVVNKLNITIEKILIWELQYMGNDNNAWTESKLQVPTAFNSFEFYLYNNDGLHFIFILHR